MGNIANYTQVKVSVDLEIAAAFKKTCADKNVSMAAVLTKFMVDYSEDLTKVKVDPDYSTRRRRRAAIKSFIKQLEVMKALEEDVLDNTPENLQGSSVYDATEEAISSLETAIETLNEF